MSKKKAKLFCKETKIKDLKLFYLWVNDPLVRRNALNTKSISWNSHQKWFKKKIKDKKAKLYIFKNKKIEVGQVRFEKKKKFVIINYSVCKKFRGKGLSKKMLSHTIKKYRPNRGTVMLGKVKPKNLRSIKVFTSLGFKSKLNKIYYFKKKY